MSAIAVVFLQKHGDKKDSEVDADQPSKRTSVISILKSLIRPPILLLGIILIPTLVANEIFLECFLAIYLKEIYQTDADVTGTIMMICGSFGLVASVLCGYLSDKGLSRSLVMMGGGLLVVVGTLFLDPSMFRFGWKSCVCPGVMFGLIGVGSSAVQVSVLPILVFHDEESDMELSTEKMVRIFNCGYFIGSSVGPLVGSALLDFLSFAVSFAIFAAFTSAIFGIALGVHIKTGTLFSVKSKVKNTYVLLKTNSDAKFNDGSFD